MVSVYYVVFAILLARRTPDFVIFLVIGQISFMWFSRSVTNASQSIISGSELINQVAIPMPFFPLLVVFQDVVKQAGVFALMFTFLAVYGLDVSWVWLSVVFVIVAQFLLICATALLVAAITPFIPDFKFLIASAMMAVMFGSGVFYSYKDLLIPKHQQIFLLNPVANLIKNYRQILMENTLPDWIALGTICLASLAIITLMTLYYRKTGTIYARLIAQ